MIELSTPIENVPNIGPAYLKIWLIMLRKLL